MDATLGSGTPSPPRNKRRRVAARRDVLGFVFIIAAAAGASLAPLPLIDHVQSTRASRAASAFGPDAASESAAALPSPTATATPIPTPTPDPSPHSVRTVDIRLGPNEAYATFGVVPAGAALEVVGRNEAGDWIAIRYPDGAGFHGWLKADAVVGVRVMELPIAVITLLP